jgi:glycosyltransferase involved in cell wall biosynthesis
MAMTKTVGYLVNQYPAASQTFIRREVAAVEAAGTPVRRYAVRPWDTELVDPDDRAEAARTRWILREGATRVLGAMASSAVRRPGPFARALAAAWSMGGASGRRLVHLVYLAEACLLRDWLEQDGVDHLHAHFGTNSAALALLCRHLGGPPYSFTMHGPEEFDRPVELSLGAKIHHAAFVAAISSFTRSQLWRWADASDWEKVHVVHCGLGPEYLDAPPAGPPPDVPRLINIGRLAEQKGQLLLVEAAARVRAQGRDFEVVVIGDGTFRPALEARIRALGLDGCVTLAGWQTGEQVRHALLGARGLVLPSFAEGLPVVLMEALALGRPVIATSIAGIPELVRPGENGWLVPAGDADALARAMAELLDTPAEQLARLGRAGTAAVARDHDVRTEARKLINLIARDGP